MELLRRDTIYYPAHVLSHEDRFIFGIRSTVVEKAINDKIDIIAYNPTTEELMRLTPYELVFDGESKDKEFTCYQEDKYKIIIYDWVPEISLVIDEWEHKLMKRINPEWMNLLHEVVGTEWFKLINRTCNNIERKSYIIRPEKENVFRVFDMRPCEIKVVFCFQDPYPNNHANGLAIATWQNTMPPTLQKVESAIIEDMGYDANAKIDKTLKHLTNQGVFLYNMALTVRNNQAGSHLDQWQPFTESVFKTLNKFEKPLIFVLFGASSAKMKKFISSKHSVFTLEHPAKAAYDGREWEHNHVFSSINTLLSNKGENPIEWII